MKAKLKTLKRGQTFYGAGIQWLVLGHTNSSQGLPIVTHIVSTGIVERRAFDEKNRNDLGVSTLLAYLNGEFLERLEDAFGEGAVAEQFIDLTSNDGLKDYGNVKAKVGLLTEEEYRQHRDILPPLGDEGWWWLATPYSTERAGYPSLVRVVLSDGALHSYYAYVGYFGVRPALYLKSDISVSLDGNDESTIEVSEEELYKAAVQKFGERAQILVAIEEMSELTKALKRGQTFYGAGIQWLVLGHTNSSQGLPIVTHIVSTGIVERRAFDEKNRNDLGVSTLLAYLNGEFLERLEDAFGEGAVAEQFIDLTSNDGLKDYGNVKAKVGLLTEEEYRQHRDILPPLGDEGWWWLATPYSTERAGYPSLVRVVLSDGALHSYYAYVGYFGVRPALYLKSDISVSLDGNDESTIEVSEEELYKAAVQKFGERAQILVAIEEMSELTKALLKYIRHEDFNQGDYDDIVESIAEERADVSIMLNQLAVIFGKNEDAKTEKLEHLADIVKDAL